MFYLIEVNGCLHVSIFVDTNYNIRVVKDYKVSVSSVCPDYVHSKVELTKALEAERSI